MFYVLSCFLGEMLWRISKDSYSSGLALKILEQNRNDNIDEYLLVGLYCANIWTVSVGLHNSNMACSAVTEVKSTPLSWKKK